MITRSSQHPYGEHDKSFYHDGNKRVDYCRVCGAESLELNEECSGEFKEKLIDKTMEPK